MAQLTKEEKLKNIEESKKVHQYVYTDKGNCNLCKIFEDKIKVLRQIV